MENQNPIAQVASLQVTEEKFLTHTTQRKGFWTQTSNGLAYHWFERWEGNAHVNPVEVGRITYTPEKKWFINPIKPNYDKARP